MRTREDIREDLDKLITAQNLLSKELKELDNKPEESTRLERLGFYDKGGDYYSLDTNNNICPFNELTADIEELFVGNSFKTEQDAQAAAKRREIMADLWSNSTPYDKTEFNAIYSIQYDFEDDRFYKCRTLLGQTISTMYFTQKTAEEMITKHGDDLKLLLI